LESPAHFKLTSKGGRQKEKPVLLAFAVRRSPFAGGPGFRVWSSEFGVQGF
jgi:hypothetical protein